MEELRGRAVESLQVLEERLGLESERRDIGGCAQPKECCQRVPEVLAA